MKRLSKFSAPGSDKHPMRIHLVYPHGLRVSAPDSIGRQLGERLRESYQVEYHDWDERAVIKPQAGEVLLGHPHPDPRTIFRRSAKQVGWRRILMMAPHTHGDLRQIAFEDSVIRDCDLFLAITGPYWFDSISDSQCSHWRPKMVHLDLAVDRSEFPILHPTFRPAGDRSFVYIGNTAWFKNTSYLTELARRTPGIRFAWIGDGARPIDGLERLGPADFATAEGRTMVAEFDFMVTVGKADANPTTILEAMAWGLIPVCTPQSGYARIPTITNVPLGDPDGAAALLARLNETPEATLLQMQVDNWRLLDKHYNWERFADQVIAAIESGASPPMDPESRGRRLAFAFYGQLSPHGPLLTGLRRVSQRAGHISRRGASAVRRVPRVPGVGDTSKGTQR